MQNYSSRLFFFYDAFLYSVFDADHEYLLSFSIRQSLRVEILRILTGCQNLKKTRVKEKQRFLVY